MKQYRTMIVTAIQALSRWTALVLLPLIVVVPMYSSVHGLTRWFCGRGSSLSEAAYLVAIGPTPLRFAEPPVPIPAAAPPPPPASASEATADEAATEERPKDITAPPPARDPIIVSSEQARILPEKKKPAQKPAALIPDDAHREMRAEDVLPYFESPASGDSGVLGGAFHPAQPPATPPPSAATYIQK